MSKRLNARWSFLKSASLPLAASALIAAAGCAGGNSTPAEGGSQTATPDAHAGHDHDHGHPSEGPHHGDLVELGNEEFHAEVVHDAGKVTVYVLDGAAKNGVPIEAAEITLNVTHDGKPEQFALPAVPESSDPMGKSSRFQLENAELAGHLDEEHSTARLVLTINGKQYNGKVEHKHDHDHDHKNE